MSHDGRPDFSCGGSERCSAAAGVAWGYRSFFTLTRRSRRDRYGSVEICREIPWEKACIYSDRDVTRDKFLYLRKGLIRAMLTLARFFALSSITKNTHTILQFKKKKFVLTNGNGRAHLFACFYSIVREHMHLVILFFLSRYVHI